MHNAGSRDLNLKHFSSYGMVDHFSLGQGLNHVTLGSSSALSGGRISNTRDWESVEGNYIVMFSWQLGYQRSFLIGNLYASADHKLYSNEPIVSTFMNRVWHRSSLIDLSKIPAAVRTWALYVQTRLRHVMAIRMALFPHVH